MKALEQQISALEADLAACGDPLERFRIEAELTVVRFAKKRADAKRERQRASAGYTEPSAAIRYNPWLGLADDICPPYAPPEAPPWTALELIERLGAIALELHLAYANAERADTHIAIALNSLNDMQVELSGDPF
ncbi:hypothetical protein KNJ79_19575 [Sphingopyxis indica]|uniref:hypothetical protein n=1 Tax=Sphingopyxis indica TaxID=436663 RepID=UPI002938DBE1|nr:hypothetical protein [Sphingopyxis indica]WOF43278.1 hypothetical protein KNJ79_19575 [Sphingopyxis indica]